MAGGQGTSENAQVNFTFGLVVDGVTIAYLTKVGGISANRPVVEQNVLSKTDKRSIIQKIPGNLEVGDITVSRAMTDNKAFTDWRQKVVDGKLADARKNGSITVYNLADEAVAKWEFKNAWPSKWELSEVTGADANPVTETLTLAVESFERTK